MRWTLLMGLAACTGTATEVVPPTGEPTTEPTTELPATVIPSTPPPGVEDAPFGYDTRPANPSCVAPAGRFQEPAEIAVDAVFATVSLANPVALMQAPGDLDSWYVIEQPGRVKRFDGSEVAPTETVVLDISSVVQNGGEMGLLGMAFHPDFATNGLAYLSFIDNARNSIIASVQTTMSGSTWDATSLTTVLSIPQPYENHNGGDLAFGPDGFLYIALGDGGAGGDPENRAQNIESLLGKILRIDVDGAMPYAIPPDNPYVGRDGRDELYAIGLRNPFRFAFDSVTGDLWVGDVGQNAYEELSRVELGGNYGWRIKEGFSCYAAATCDDAGLIDPVVDYAQSPGRSIIGGEVYRGAAIPALVGSPLFSDFYTGDIERVVYAADGEASIETLVSTGASVVDFASGHDGEVYFLDRLAGTVHKLVEASAGPPAPFPMTLSETGCVVPDAPTTVMPGVLPYQMNHGFWSDGAEKNRWLAVPDGAQIELTPTGDFEFPLGSVLIKDFTVNNVLVETRLFMNHADDGWAGYAYRWRADGSDADLLRAAERLDVDGVSWQIPSPAECMQCHTAAAGRSLGLEAQQLTGFAVYPDTMRRSPQLDTLAHIGLLATDPGTPTALPAIDDASASVAERARAYLHVNCAQCHQPDGPGRGSLDLRVTTDLVDTRLCGEPLTGDLGLADARIVAPGSPNTSVLVARMRDLGANRMPPMATEVVDTVGLQVLDQWITELSSCP